MTHEIKISSEDVLIKIHALAQAAALLDGNDDEKLIMIELLDVIVETASLGIERNG